MIIGFMGFAQITSRLGKGLCEDGHRGPVDKVKGVKSLIEARKLAVAGKN